MTSARESYKRAAGNVRTTAKGRTLYLHGFEWPKQERLEVPDLGARVTSINLLAGRQRLHFERPGNGVCIVVPAQAPDAEDIVLEVKTS